MVLRKIVPVTDNSLNLLGILCEVKTDTGWEPKRVTLRDIACSEFVFDLFSKVIDMRICGASSSGGCLAYMHIESIAESVHEPLRIMGCDLSKGSVDVESALMLLRASMNKNKEVISLFGGIEGLQPELTEFLKQVGKDTHQLVSDSLELNLFLTPSFRAKIGEPEGELAKYLLALEQHAYVNIRYAGGPAEKEPIKESDIILPYNAKMLERVSNGILKPWDMGFKSGGSNEIGPQVMLPIVSYSDFISWVEAASANVDSTEEEDDSEIEMDSSDAQAEDDIAEISRSAGDTAEFHEQENVLKSIELRVSGNPLEIEGLREAIDFTIEDVPRERSARDSQGGLFKAVPINEDVYPITKITYYYDCYNYKNVVNNSAYVDQPIDPQYVGGFPEANLVGLTPREKCWLAVYKQVSRDLLMYEQNKLNVAEAEQLNATGVSSKTLNNFIQNSMIKPILQITRGYTGYVPVDIMDYRPDLIKNKEGDNEVSYAALRTCFYDVTPDRKLIIQPTPSEFIPPTAQSRQQGLDTHRYVTLPTSLDSFVCNYVRNADKWLEVVLKLLRSDKFKPTMLVLEGAEAEQRRENVPIYFDLNTCEAVFHLDNARDLIPEPKQEISFGITLTSPEMKKICNSLDAMRTDVLGDMPMYEDGFLVGVGLWSKYQGDGRTSKVDFMDIFTFVNYMTKGKQLSGVDMSPWDIVFDKEVNKFKYEDPADCPIDATLRTLSNGKEVPGSFNLITADSEGFFTNFESKASGRMEKEYRGIIESEEYVTARAKAVRLTNSPKLGQSEVFGVFKQLLQVSVDPRRLDRSKEMYERLKNATQLTVSTDFEQYVQSMLDIQYTVRFFHLISYCLKNGVTPRSSFVDYVNKVYEFMQSYQGNVSSGQDPKQMFERIVENAAKWYVLSHNKASIGLLTESADEKGAPIFAVCLGVGEGQQKMRELITKIKEKGTPTAALDFTTAYERVLQKHIDSAKQRIFNFKGGRGEEVTLVYNRIKSAK